MAEHNELGKRGENSATIYLTKSGYTILESNWRAGRHEIDIVALKGKILVIVEVKTRQSTLFGEPELAVTREKQRALIKAANAYLFMKRLSYEVQFDIISIVIDKENERIHHIPDAFYPTII